MPSDPQKTEATSIKLRKVTAIGSSFALLDVKRGRGALFKALGYSSRDSAAPIPVTITGFIVGAWGDDDGESREFQIDVREVKVT